MISISHLSAGAVSSKYYHEDGYYSEKDGEDKSRWLGEAAKEEGLTGPVNDEKFQELLHGHAPDGRELSRVNSDGTTSRRMGYDLTFSAPKDVSVMALVAGDQRLIEAHDKAVAETIKIVEEQGIKVRVYDPAIKDKVRVGDQKAMFAVFRHDTSRSLDPQLHSHVIIPNMAKGPDGKYRAIANEELFNNRKIFDAHYKAHLAQNIHAIGYQITREGQHGDIRIAGVGDDVGKIFSKRREEIVEAVKDSIDPNASAAAERAALFTRANKAKDIDRAELKGHWINEIRAIGRDYLQIENLMREATARRENGEIRNTQTASALINSAVRHFSENDSLYSQKHVMEYALNRSVSTSAEALEVAIQMKLDRGDLYHAKSEHMPDGLTDNKTVAREARMIGELYKGRNASHATMGLISRWATNPVKSVDNSLKNSTLTDGQKDSAKIILASEDRVVGVQGYAGTGKTYMLEKAQNLANRKGYQFEAIGPSSKSVEALNGSNLNATTVSRFLISAASGGLGNKKDKVLIVDEASMISTKDMTDLLRLANKAEYNRVVLLGDTAQLASVGAGAAFRQLQESGMKVAYMNEIQRQKVADLRQGVEALAARDVSAAFDKIGNRIETDKKGEYVRNAAAHYLALTPEERAKTGVIVQTNKARVDANQTIRDGLKEEKRIGETDVTKDHLNQENLSTEQKRYADNYHSGQRIVVHRDIPKTNFRAGMELTVQSRNVKDNTIQVVSPDGKTRTLNPSSSQVAAGLGVYNLEARDYAQGDQVIFRMNNKEAGVINGTRGSVTSVDDKSVSVKTDEGQTIRLSNDQLALKTMDHSYTATVHAYQGETVDRIIIAMGAKEALTNNSAAYVAVSRAKFEATLHTDNAADLAKTLSERSGVSETAFDGLVAAYERDQREAEAEKLRDQTPDYPRAKDLLETRFDEEREKEMERNKDEKSTPEREKSEARTEQSDASPMAHMEREMRHAQDKDQPAKSIEKDSQNLQHEEVEIER